MHSTSCSGPAQQNNVLAQSDFATLGHACGCADIRGRGKDSLSEEQLKDKGLQDFVTVFKKIIQREKWFFQAQRENCFCIECSDLLHRPSAKFHMHQEPISSRPT